MSQVLIIISQGSILSIHVTDTVGWNIEVCDSRVESYKRNPGYTLTII